MAKNTLRTQRTANPAVKLSSTDLLPLRQGTQTQDSVAQISDLAAYYGPNANYFFHVFAGDQVAGRPAFFDISGNGNHGTFGANLSNANAWANAGFVSTVAPASGTANACIRLPGLNFDYAGGQKMLLWWCGKATPGGSDVGIIGDGYGTTYPGLRLRLKSTGKVDFGLSGSGISGTDYSSITATTAFDGTLHDIGLLIDGAGRQYGIWIDGVLDSIFGGVYLSFASGVSIGTTNSNTFQIGASTPLAGDSNLDGAAIQTYATAILRLPAATSVPAVSTVTSLIAQLRAFPAKPLAGSAF